MTEQSTKSLRLGVVAAILLGLVGTGFGIYQFVKEKDLAQEIANVKSTVNQVKDAEGVTFKSKAEFEAAVVKHQQVCRAETTSRHRSEVCPVRGST